uniref:Retinoic acid receptor responder protein 2 n=1 Tax=Podarcis muralis TaxID=64176 RepID=A0A670JC53_PODMU
MKGLLVLCLGLLALADANQSPLQQRALELVLDFFHSRDLVQATFKEQAVTHVTETEFPRGTYVQLEVDLVQTICRKQQRGTQNCRIKPGGRKQKCLACFKFNSSDPQNILDESKRCLSEQNPIFQMGFTFTGLFSDHQGNKAPSSFWRKAEHPPVWVSVPQEWNHSWSQRSLLSSKLDFPSSFLYFPNKGLSGCFIAMVCGYFRSKGAHPSSPKPFLCGHLYPGGLFWSIPEPVQPLRQTSQLTLGARIPGVPVSAMEMSWGGKGASS